MKHVRRASVALVALAMSSPVARGAAVTVYNFNGTANDTVGGRNLTLANASFSSDTPSGSGQSLAFDGTSTRATYDVVGGDALAGNFTVAAYVKYTGASATGNGNVVRSFFGTRSPGETSFDAKLINGNTVHGDIGNGSGTWFSTSADAPFTYNLNQWYHVAYSVVSPTAGSAGSYTIYVDGNNVGGGALGASATPTLLVDSNHDIAVGNAGFSTNGGEFFQGFIDDVGIYNTALSQSEVRALLAPEPGTAGVLAAVAAMAAGCRRRRGKN